MKPNEYTKVLRAMEVWSQMGMEVRTTSKYWEVSHKDDGMLGAFEDSDELYQGAVCYQQGYYRGLGQSIKDIEQSVCKED